ncbi:MAG: NAD(P)/FAD-dependent oxidoreductase [Solirubrobacterales bacterium]|nr:NAD(P)/FAD-dependent oxidoreductase [Solirubrobacterales bacterium]
MPARPAKSTYDAVIVGGGHNGLVAAAYLARAGRSVLMLEQNPTTGGAAVSARAFPGLDARVSRYSYLVSLLPRSIVEELGLRFESRRRRISSYTPSGATGLLVDASDPARTQASMSALTGGEADFAAWQRLGEETGRLAEALFPTLTEPLRGADDLRALLGDEALWEALIERPLGETIEARFADDLVRGVVLTDALIGTFAGAHDASLLQNRCFLYHVIGGGTGDWDVPVGGMGALTDALARAAGQAGAEIVCEAEVTQLATDGQRAEVRVGDAFTVTARDVLCGAAPAVLARLLGEEPAEPAPEGAQLKVNMLLTRLPRLRDAAVDPREAFAGTFHVAEGYAALERAREQAAAGTIPLAPPCELYCHSLTDTSILSDELRASGHQTLTLFGLHMPARLFAEEPEKARERALFATLQTLDEHLAEPLESCLATDADGRPCLEVSTPLDLEAALGLPAGHIFHRDLRWPWAEAPDEIGTWGVETAHANVLLCGAGARRGGGVSGVPGHNAARALLAR